MTTPTIDVRRSGDRFHTRLGWLDSKHSFSFGHHRDPNTTGHGLLLVNTAAVVNGLPTSMTATSNANTPRMPSWWSQAAMGSTMSQGAWAAGWRLP